MNFRYVGTRIYLVRVLTDETMHAQRTKIVGFIPRSTLEVNLSKEVELTEPERLSIQTHIEALQRREELRDEEAFLSLPECVERISRFLGKISESDRRNDAAKTLVFLSLELRRLARSISDV